jgi:hypothetical protein
MELTVPAEDTLRARIRVLGVKDVFLIDASKHTPKELITYHFEEAKVPKQLLGLCVVSINKKSVLLQRMTHCHLCFSDAAGDGRAC